MQLAAALAILAALAPSSTPASSGRAGASGDACSLLTAAELRQAQGGVLRNSKPTSHSQGGLAVSECFFETNPFSSSVSLEVVRRGVSGIAGRSPRERWREMFHSAGMRKKSEEGEERESRLEPVSGIGEEAFWVPGRMGGLYVLRSDVSLRLSVGGKGDPEAKREKSKILARKALEKL